MLLVLVSSAVRLPPKLTTACGSPRRASVLRCACTTFFVLAIVNMFCRRTMTSPFLVGSLALSLVIVAYAVYIYKYQPTSLLGADLGPAPWILEAREEPWGAGSRPASRKTLMHLLAARQGGLVAFALPVPVLRPRVSCSLLHRTGSASEGLVVRPHPDLRFLPARLPSTRGHTSRPVSSPAMPSGWNLTPCSYG
jgi:hypothetical protein